MCEISAQDINAYRMGLIRQARSTPDKSAIDAVDGSSTGTWVPRMWVRLILPRFGGANHANGHNHRSRHCEV